MRCFTGPYQLAYIFLTRMKYFLLYIGCQMNQSDAERVRTVLHGMGMQRTDVEEEADLLGIVACSVRQRAIDRVFTRIKKWNDWKKNNALITFITGCMLTPDEKRFSELFDILFHISDLPALPDLIRQCGSFTATGEQPYPAESSASPVPDFWHIQPHYSSTFQAYVPIQNGCDKFCAFCAVPLARGREISRSSDDILSEISQLLEDEYKSITLLGQNVNSYGRDKKGSEIDFPTLLRFIAQLVTNSLKEVWLYFTSPHPQDMSEELLHTIAEYPCLGRQVHLPLQSGDDTVLKRMNRHYKLSHYRQTVTSIRSILPDTTLFTDLIVGFPGETPLQFEKTRQAMEEFKFNMAYIAMYSPRPGAASCRMADNVPHEEKNRRLHILSEVLKKHSYEYNNNLVGRTLTVLVEGLDRKDGYLSAKTNGRIIVRFPAEDKSLIGTFASVKITSAAPLSVEGQLVSQLHPTRALS